MESDHGIIGEGDVLTRAESLALLYEANINLNYIYRHQYKNCMQTTSRFDLNESSARWCS